MKSFQLILSPITRHLLRCRHKYVKKVRFSKFRLWDSFNSWSTDEAYYFKRALKCGFLNFHQIFFLAFNSRDITMLWVLNLFSRSSPTKLWKRIFDKMSQKIFFDTQSWQVVRFSHIDSVGKVKFGSKISMKTLFPKKFFMFIKSMRTCFASSRDCGKLLKLYFNQ